MTVFLGGRGGGCVVRVLLEGLCVTLAAHTCDVFGRGKGGLCKVVMWGIWRLPVDLTWAGCLVDVCSRWVSRAVAVWSRVGSRLRFGTQNRVAPLCQPRAVLSSFGTAKQHVLHDVVLRRKSRGHSPTCVAWMSLFRC